MQCIPHEFWVNYTWQLWQSVDILYVTIYNCEFTASKMNSEWVVVSIGPIHKGVSLFLLDTTMNKVNSLHHMKEYPKISNLP